MRANEFKMTLARVVKAGVVASLLMTASAMVSAQSVTLTAKAQTVTLPDGQTVPMWGYTCSAAAVAPATCASTNPNAGANWSPIVITTPPGSLTISLTNNLPAPVPTSLVIVGQLGGGLGNTATSTASPVHATQTTTTWPIAASNTGASFTPPAQPPRVQSFATEVTNGNTTPVQLTWSNLNPGTYLIESGTHPSIQGPMGLYGVLVVTTPPGTSTRGTAYPGVNYDADVPLVLSEIDPVQNQSVATAVATPGFSETRVWSGLANQCGNPASANYNTCYPPAVNYDPRYYLINGLSFDRTNPTVSAFPATAPVGTGQILVRFVNAGLRMHVPSIVGAQSGSPSTSGVALIAEDGNVLPGNPRIQSAVFLAAGKTSDVLIYTPPTGSLALPVFDRQLSLSTNNQRDGGMQGYIAVNGAAAPTSAAGSANAVANPDTYFLVAGNTLTVSDPAKGVIANDVGVYGVQVKTPPTSGTLTLNANGTFTYVPNAGTTSDSFVYQANGNPAITALVTLAPCTAAANCLSGTPVAVNGAYTSNIASQFHEGAPGVLLPDHDPSGLPLTASIVGSATGGTVTLNADGSFNAVPSAPPKGTATATVTFQYKAVNSQNTASNPATVTVTFKGGSGLAVKVLDAPSTLPGKTAIQLTDYRWIIEEDRTFQIDPACQVNSATRPATCPPLPVPSLGTNFHTSYMPVVAAGCVGKVACESGQTVFNPATNAHVNTVCDIGDGQCRMDLSASQQTPVDPSQVALDPTKHYYLSILPGDAGNTFANGGGAPVGTRQFDISKDCPSGAGGADFAPGTGKCGHAMGGAPIAPAQTAVNVPLQETPLQTAKISVFVFEDDAPVNGEVDVSGGTDAFGTAREPGLGGFEIKLFDDAGGTGDATGQMSYDMFNMPLSNALNGTIDPSTGLNACPISTTSTDGLVGMIPTCPKFESDGKTYSPLVGQAIIANLMPGRYGVVANPAADRIARGEEWLQTNTLDGQKAHDAFIKVGGPAYFQEFGPAGFHVTIGFANPKIINDRLPGYCQGVTCNNGIKGMITNLHYSRPPNENLYHTGSRQSLSFTQCYVSVGDPDGEDIAFTKCNADGTFSISGLPDGTYRITVFDQWNDQIVDGLATAVQVKGGQTADVGELSVLQWHTNLYTRTYLDSNGTGVSNGSEAGLALVPTNVRFRDGSYSNFLSTDLNGYASFNEVFPLFNWYVVEADTTRYKQTGVHAVYDAGGPPDGTTGGGSSTIAAHYANTQESATAHLPTALRVPGAIYCNDADCNDHSGTNPSTGRIDPPWVTTEGWQGFSGQSSFLEFGKAPFAAGENGGIVGEVVYASTRPFDDPTLLIHNSWTPNVPGVTVNLYQEGTAPDGTQSLTLVDTTKTSSWDDWAQGFRSDGMPNMNCPGQETTDPFFFTLQNSTQWLDPNKRALPNNSQFKCYDGMHAFNQLQPAPYDGMYQFPSVTGRNPSNGAVTGTNCTICVADPTDTKYNTKMLPPGKYVVEVIVPPGYELVKEEDKNILIGDNYIAPVTQQFGSLGNIFILPDQAAVNATYNANNAQNSTTDLGSPPRTDSGKQGDEQLWPCVGALRVVPDYISLFPGSKEVAPFAGASRHLCDRKEVTLSDQMTARAKFWIFSSTHVSAHFTGFMLDDFSSEFDPYSPQFGEKFAVPNVPVSIKDFAGNEVSRLYSDAWGIFNGLNYSTWQVNPPNPTGYAPTMMVACMNDPDMPDPAHPGQTIRDPLYNPAYSQFCYEIPFMPGQTQYMDTPVVPVSAFADGYNPPDCAYPDGTPAISSVTGDTITGGGAGPWVSQATLLSGQHRLTIKSLGNQTVPNNAYGGPSATTAPYNQKFVTRHYGFGTTQGTGKVTIGGVNATVRSWSDTQIVVDTPVVGLPFPGLNGCTIQQRGVGAIPMCGELVVTASNGKQSIDAVTVTIGGKAPTYVNGENATSNAIQSAIDKATSGDLIIVGPGTYNEMLLMWKPVRLQGVGAPSVVVNANTHPSGKLDPWRRQVDCLFGIALNGAAISASNPYDPTGTYSCTTAMQRKVDPIPLEPTFGWDNSLNGNLGELLQEPALMGAYEGAGITVLAKGVRDVNGQADPNCTANGICTPLTNSNADCNAYSSNFLCNPSRIDGLTFTNSSQGGGGIFLHGWNHSTEVSNNRVFANAGTLTGGITVGQVEVPDGTIAADGFTQLPYLYNKNVNVHHNSVTSNASYGDEINSTTPSSAAGVTFCSGSDYYKFNNNWVCGNMSSGDGGGVAHFGFSYNGTVSHNWILFNQSNNPTLPTYGGGLIAQGVPPDGTFCENAAIDTDCAPELPDGVGPGLVIDGNLILGNTAESGKGGGLRLQNINGTDVQRSPSNPNHWYAVSVINNIIANNVAGWSGGGVSVQDAVRVSFINNTVVSNDSTATAGVLFNTALAAQANVGPPNCTTVGAETTCSPITTSTNQPSGLETAKHTQNFLLAFTAGNAGCPAGQNCSQFSIPVLTNDVFWHNRTFHITVGGLDTGIQGLQNVVTLNPTLNQGGHATGYCDPAAAYWDIGAYGDTGPADHSSGVTLAPQYSIITDIADYNSAAAHNIGTNPAVVSLYCNGSRKPPEAGGIGFTVPPGIADTVLPNPLFSLLPSATPDEGNQWINMSYGPLSLFNMTITSGSTGYGVPLGNYSIRQGSPAVNTGTAAGAPNHDFFGTPRPQGGGYDIGAVELPSTQFAGNVGGTLAQLLQQLQQLFGPLSGVPQ
ncbi:choice-of-anchor Q domain-containing protein [Paraburkholderia sp. HP33-1]|uniref:choice-of-anchor Q domain-containing protein n=1 Tax=Paraburkholderia sp. HP33-1 TaxID=2883243 RepID=UPI001F1E9E93|nr:choice-of-anchor Q domain-containing protein [Paraburkholderia sp. HP33-1]